MDSLTYLRLFRGLDPECRQIMLQLQAMFSFAGLSLGGRGTHTDGVFARGTLTPLRGRDLPSHALFDPTRTYSVLFRHANIVGGGDDACPNGRGAALRIGAPGQDLSNPALHDMILNTGEVFGLPTARLYLDFFKADFQGKSDMLAAGTLRRLGVVDGLRDPSTYTEVRYHTQLCFEWIDVQRRSRYARFRLLDPSLPLEGGRLPADTEIGPRLILPRRSGDSRSKTHLRDEFRARLKKGPVQYVLQVQLRSMVPEALDCTAPWDAKTWPWMDVATISLTVDATAEPGIDAVGFNPATTHSDIVFPASRTADDLASLGMSGALVHYYGARVRREGTQYLYGPADALPGIPDHLPLPVRELPSRRYLLLRSLLPDVGPEYPVLLGQGSVHERSMQVQESMPVTALDLQVGAIAGGEVPDAYFLERRLNGYFPGAIRDADEEEWTHEISFDLTRYALKPGLSFPTKLDLRVVVDEGDARLHSIEIDGVTTLPGQGQAWADAKRRYLQAEFVLQELKLHLARCHINMEQYVLAMKRRLPDQHPVRRFVDAHLEGLIFINKVGVPQIVGGVGFITLASSLTERSLDEVMLDELRKLSHMWEPTENLPANDVPGDLFAPAVRRVWHLLEEYVTEGLLVPHAAELAAEPAIGQVRAMFDELKARSFSPPNAAMFAPSELKRLLMYVVYHSVFLHSWANYKQYDDAGNPAHVTMGDYEAFGPVVADKLRVSQRGLTWVLSSVRYNPVLTHGPALLQRLVRREAAAIQPGLPLGDLMMSINI